VSQALEVPALPTEGDRELIDRAWAVLGDVDERSAYGRQRLRATRAPRPGPRVHSSGPSDDFRPFDDDGDDTFDERDDRPITNTRLPRWLTMTPAMLVAGGLLALAFGGLIGVLPLLTLGLISMLLGGLSFMALPILAVGMAARADRRR
jgi:hypothetical protein